MNRFGTFVKLEKQQYIIRLEERVISICLSRRPFGDLFEGLPTN
jgi:hypothetical protein